MILQAMGFALFIVIGFFFLNLSVVILLALAGVIWTIGEMIWEWINGLHVEKITTIKEEEV